MKQYLKDKIRLFKCWLNTPPDEADAFFVNFRKTYQCIFKCKHHWEHPRGPYSRTCTQCSDYQCLMYSRYGDIRYEWKSFRI